MEKDGKFQFVETKRRINAIIETEKLTRRTFCMVLIEQVEINDSLKKDIQKEFEKYEAKDGVSFNHTPFCFVAKENGKVIGAITGFRCFSEIYIDELIVFEHQRGKHIGTQLIQMVEDTYKNQNLHNVNLCTYEFQAPEFYKKLGFELEFVRRNNYNSKLNKYYYVKYFDKSDSL
mgnify:FL=1